MAVFVLAVLQLSAMPQLIPGSATPDLLLILVVAVALIRGAEAAALTGFAAGVLLDALLIGRLGLTSLLYIAAGLWVAYRVEPVGHGRGTRPCRRCRGAPSRCVYVSLPRRSCRSAWPRCTCCWATATRCRYELVQIVIMPTVVETAWSRSSCCRCCGGCSPIA